MPKIALIVTARDAERLLPDLFASVNGHVDAIVVGVDNRTTDQTRDVAKAAGALVEDVEFIRDGVMDFAQARNQTFAYADKVLPPDIDWYVWLDSDDVLAGPPDGRSLPAANLHDIVDDGIRSKPSVEAIWLPYTYSRDPWGQILHELYRERLIRRDAYVGWTKRLHELLRTRGGPEGIWSEGGLVRSKARVIVDHRNRFATEEGKYERNFPILMKSYEEHPEDLNVLREIGEVHFATAQWDEAVSWYDRYLMASDGNRGVAIEERWQVVIQQSRALRMMGQHRQAIMAADRAMLMVPRYKDSYLELAYCHAERGSWAKAIWWLEQAERPETEVPAGILQTSPLDYECIPYQVLHVAYARTGNFQKALECIDIALRYRPTNDELLRTRQQYTHFYARRSIVDNALLHAQYLMDNGEALKARGVIDTLPVGAAEDFPEVASVEDRISEATAHLANHGTLRTLVQSLPQRPPTLRPWIARRLAGAGRVLVAGVDAVALAKAGIPAVAIEHDPRVMAAGNRAAVEANYMDLMAVPEHTPLATPTHVHDPICHPFHDERCQQDTEGCEKPLCTLTAHPHEEWTPDCDLCGPVLMVPDMRPEAEAQYHVADPDRIPKRVLDLGPYDAVVLDGVLERCLDPEETLASVEKVAKRVLIVAPDGTAPAAPDPTLVRSYSRQQLETLAFSRGRVVESHFLDGDMGFVGIEYIVGETIAQRPPICIFCGPGFEQWTPDQIDTVGLGGSETAVVHVARELVAHGGRVMVYAETEGIWDGVFYRHHAKFQPRGNMLYAFIAWRNAALFDVDITAERRYLWLHDIDAGDSLTDARAAKITAVLAVSDWHAAHLRERHPNVADKVTTLRNAIDPTRFAGTEERDPYRFVYVSSPDRGLERALVMWPFVKKAIPEATLHVYYGWENYDLMGREPSFKRWVMRKAEADGITWHGRVGQRELAREYMRSGALFYPGPHGFRETFCISALEAQAAGCIPVTRDNGALVEVNRYGLHLPTADATITDYIDGLRYASAVGEDGIRGVMREWALTQTWKLSVEAFLARAEADTPPEPEAEPEEVPA